MRHVFVLLAISVSILAVYLLIVTGLCKFVANRQIVIWVSVVALPLVVFSGFLLGILTGTIY